MAKDNENKEVTIKKINSVISLYNSSFERPTKWPIEDDYINGLNKEKLKVLLSDNKEALFKSPSNGVAGINWGAMSDAGDFAKLDDNKIGHIAEKLWEVLSSLSMLEEDENTENQLKDNYQNLLGLFKKSTDGFSRTYNVLAARLVVTFALGELFAVPGNTQIFQVAEELGFEKYKEPQEWIVANRKIVQYVKNNCQDALDKLYDDTTKPDSFEGKRKFTMLGWGLACNFGVGDSDIDKLVKFVTDNQNVIFSGAPGTGKSFLAKRIAYAITEQDENTLEQNKRWKMVQFHPSYDYTDFVEGMRPEKSTSSNNIEFVYREGEFRAFCHKAADDQSTNNYVFIIDEINRGDVNKIFGELFYSIDPDKRGTGGRITTQYDNINTQKGKFESGFYVPENVYIIGTMNDIDRSVESLDFAFRRRFAWKEIGWDFSVDDILMGLTDEVGDKISLPDVRLCLKSLNKLIINSPELGPAYCIGGSFLEKLKKYQTKNTENAVKEVWKTYIENVVREYLRGTDLKLDDFKNVFLSPLQTSKK